jgi:hypothetical protein
MYFTGGRSLPISFFAVDLILRVSSWRAGPTSPNEPFPIGSNSAGILVVLLTTPFNLVFPFLTVSLLTTCSHHQGTRVELRVLLGREKETPLEEEEELCELHPIWGDAP